MFNQSPFNAEPLNQGSPFSIDVVTDDIIFDGFGLQNTNIVSSFKDDQNFPNINLETFQNPVIDGGGVLNRRFTSKDIKISGVLRTSTADELNDLIDEFKRKTSTVEGYLDIKVNGIYRRTKASVVSSNVFPRQHYDITRCRFEITFKTVEPFFYFKTSETVSEEGITSNAHNLEFSYLGNAPSFPKVYLIFGSVATTDEIELTLNGKRIFIEETISTSDIVLLDGTTKTVKINGVEVDYSGTFPNLQYGSNLFEFNINGTFSVDITVLYKVNRL